MAGSSPDIDALDIEDLKSLLVRVLEENAALRAEVAALREGILSDDAGQFDVGRHALCWVYAERLVHKLDTFCERQRRAKERNQARIWWLYADLKAYCRDPTPGPGGRCACASTAYSKDPHRLSQPCAALLRQLQLPGGHLEQETPCRGQGLRSKGAKLGGILVNGSPRRSHRHQPEPSG
jgi:hypothetical protein